MADVEKDTSAAKSRGEAKVQTVKIKQNQKGYVYRLYRKGGTDVIFSDEKGQEHEVTVEEARKLLKEQVRVYDDNNNYEDKPRFVRAGVDDPLG